MGRIGLSPWGRGWGNGLGLERGLELGWGWGVGAKCLVDCPRERQ